MKNATSTSSLPSPEAKATVISHLETSAKTDLFFLESRLNKLRRGSLLRSRLDSHTASGSCTQEILQKAKDKETLLNAYNTSYRCKSLDDLAEILHVRTQLRELVIDKILTLENVISAQKNDTKKKRSSTTMGSSRLVAAVISLLDMCGNKQKVVETKTSSTNTTGVETKTISTNTNTTTQEPDEDNSKFIQEIENQTALLQSEMREYETSSKGKNESEMIRWRDEFEQQARNEMNLYEKKCQEHEEFSIRNERETFQEYELNTTLATNILREEFESKLQSAYGDREILNRELEEARVSQKAMEACLLDSAEEIRNRDESLKDVMICLETKITQSREALERALEEKRLSEESSRSRFCVIEALRNEIKTLNDRCASMLESESKLKRKILDSNVKQMKKDEEHLHTVTLLRREIKELRKTAKHREERIDKLLESAAKRSSSDDEASFEEVFREEFDAMREAYESQIEALRKDITSDRKRFRVGIQNMKTKVQENLIVRQREVQTLHLQIARLDSKLQAFDPDHTSSSFLGKEEDVEEKRGGGGVGFGGAGLRVIRL